MQYILGFLWVYYYTQLASSKFRNSAQMLRTSVSIILVSSWQKAPLCLKDERAHLEIFQNSKFCFLHLKWIQCFLFHPFSLFLLLCSSYPSPSFSSSSSIQVLFQRADTWNINIGRSSNWQTNGSRREIVKKYRRNYKKMNKKQENRENFKTNTVIDILINKRARWYEHVSRKNTWSENGLKHEIKNCKKKKKKTENRMATAD